MKLNDYFALKGRGEQARMARAIQGYQPDIRDWCIGARPVPAHRCPAIETFTAGLVTRQELRPNDWHVYWPELAKEAAHAQEAS